MSKHDATTRAPSRASADSSPPRRFRSKHRRIAAWSTLAAAATLATVAAPGRAQSLPAPDVVPPAPETPVEVDESMPPPVSAPSKVLPGWKELWGELPKSAADLRIALAEIERAEAATRTAVAALVPSLNGSLSLSYAPPRTGAGSPFTLQGGTFQAQLSASVPLVNVRAFHQIGTQELLEDIKHLEVGEVRRKLALSLARGAASIAAAQRAANANRVSLDLALQRLALTRSRLNAGMGDTRDLVRAQQDVASARAVIAPADETLRQAQEGLAVLIGSKTPVGLGADLENLEQQVIEFCGAASTTEATRLDVLIAQKNIDVAERNVTNITLKFLPTLSASGSLSTYGPAFDGPFRPGWSIGLTLQIPIFDGGVRYAEKKDRVAQVEIAKARAIQTDIAATIEKNQARRALEVALIAYKSAKEARDLAAEADRLARVAYANGIGTNFELIDAGRKLREVEAQLVLRDLDVAKARLALPFVEGSCAGLGNEGGK